MIQAVSSGRSGTAMKAFASVLSTAEIEAVVDFVRNEFMINKAPNTRYHTKENGWDHHERYAAAFPFALGELPVDTPWEQLSEEQRQGKRIFMNSCVSCHDRATVTDSNVTWELRPLSYPRNQYDHREPSKTPVTMQSDRPASDTTSGASPYAAHDVAPKLTGLTDDEKAGEALFQGNCAFCHGADGTGKNWIGSFLQPHPRDLTDAANMSSMTRARIENVIREGLPETTMPTWKYVLNEKQIKQIADYVNKAFHPLAENGG